MKIATTPRWEEKRTAETRSVEEVLRKVFPQTDAYRFNPASIRVRVVDPRFKGKSNEKRMKLVEPVLAQLPESIEAEIMRVWTLYPGEADASARARIANAEFEDPSESML